MIKKRHTEGVYSEYVLTHEDMTKILDAYASLMLYHQNSGEGIDPRLQERYDEIFEVMCNES